MRDIIGTTFADVYESLLNDVYNHYEYETAPRGMNIREITNCALVIRNPYSNLFKNDVRNLPLKYLKKELALYLSGRNDVDGFGNASKFWKKIANDDGTVNSAYGNLIFKMTDTPEGKTQWEWMIESLIKDKDSRQAIMHFNQPVHQYSGVKDFPCTLEMTFHIRNDKLNATTTMRSNDVIKGTTFDVPFFTLLQQMALDVLRHKAYPELQMGSYTHIAHSMHLYESDFELVGNMLKNSFIPDAMPRITDASEILASQKLFSDIVDGGENSEFRTVILENAAFINWLRTGID